MCESDTINTYLKQVIKKEDLIEYEIKTPGKTGRGDGYLGQVTFVSISGKTKNKERKKLNLVLKTSGKSDLLRQQVPIKELFQKEIYIYDEVRSTFKNFQQEVGVQKDLLSFVPELCHSDKTDKDEFLILQNLKHLGFDVWDRMKPMPYDHFSLVLESLGKWHAFSFALKNKEPEIFEKLVQANDLNMWPVHISKMGINDLIFTFFDEVRTLCKNDNTITNNLTFTKNDTKYILKDLFFEDPNYHVILHGDCWTNNLMFKLDSDTQTPIDVRFIDWQLSAIASPVMDLSYFIYTCIDTGMYNNIEDLLKIYYRNLSDCLLELGCDPSLTFPYETLMKHWQRFSRFGLVLGTLVLKYCLAAGHEVPDFAETLEMGRDFLDSLEITIANEDLYRERVKNNFLHYVRNS